MPKQLFLKTRETELIAQLRASYTQLAQAATDIKFVGAKYLELLDREHTIALTSLQEKYESQKAAYQRAIDSTAEEMDFIACGWTDPSWHEYRPSSMSVPQYVRAGQFIARGTSYSMRAPALIPLQTPGNIVILAKGAGKNAANSLLQSIMLRALATFPAGKLRFTLLDPVGLGKNVAGFMQLPEPIITSGRAWTETQHIEAQLAALTEHMENVIQKYLLHRYETIEQYNAQAGEVAEPYRFLVAVNFPINFSPEAARRLTSIATNGASTGVHTLVTIDLDQELPHGFVLDDLCRTATVLDWLPEGTPPPSVVSAGRQPTDEDRRIFDQSAMFTWSDLSVRPLDFLSDQMPDGELLDHISQSVIEVASSLAQVKVPFAKVVAGDMWTNESSQSVRTLLGRRGAREMQAFELGQGTNHHALIVGRTGAGKSNLLHVLICSLAHRYSPDEIELYLVDSKFGVEFKDYATLELPHARVVSINSDREFALSVLSGLDTEMARRGDLFRAAGCSDLAAYRQRTDEVLPRCLFIMDEFHELFVEDDSISGEAARILTRLVQQGRAFGIHIVLATQTLAPAFSFSKSLFGQMNVRIALQCNEADSRLILAEDNPTARLLERQGEAVYNDKGGLIEGNNIFQTAYLPSDERAQALIRYRTTSLTAKLKRRREKLIVFEGNEPGRLINNEPLIGLLRNRAAVAPTVPVAWLGEPTTIKPHTVCSLRRQAHSNLLIVGNNEVRTFGILAAVFISLIAQYRLRDGDLRPQSQPANFLLLNYGRSDEIYSTVLGELASACPLPIRQPASRELRASIGELAEELDRRITANHMDASSTFVLFGGVQRARELRETNDYGEPSELSKQFLRVCHEGPEFGIHIIAVCDTVASLEKTLGRRSLEDFGVRVGLTPISRDDSDTLFDSNRAALLDPQRALFVDEERVGVLEQFRPYDIPSTDELNRLLDMLRS